MNVVCLVSRLIMRWLQLSPSALLLPKEYVNPRGAHRTFAPTLNPNGWKQLWNQARRSRLWFLEVKRMLTNYSTIFGILLKDYFK